MTTFGRLGSLGGGFGRLGGGQGGAVPPNAIIAGAGSYAWTGQDATLTVTELKSVAGGSGSYTWTGADATPVQNHIIAASGGSYTYTGQDATLTYSGGAWTPASLSGLIVWLDASVSASVIRSGANVSAWNDQSGNGNNFTATNNPQYSATSFPGSLPGISSWSGSAYIRNASISLNSATLSCFAVFSMTSTNAFGGIVSIQGASGGNDFNTADGVAFSAGNNNQTTSVARGGSPSYSGSRNITTGSARSGGYVFNGTQGITYGDFSGTTAASSSTAAIGNTTAAIAIGVRQSTGPSFANPWIGPISEVIITTSAITGTDLTNLQAYWAAKWGTP